MKLSATVSRKDIKRIKKKFDKVDPKDRASLTYRAFINASLVVENSLKKNLSGKMLKVQTGSLRNSIESTVRVNQIGIQAEIGSGIRTRKRLPYANLHETGGTIRPKKAKHLTIPIGDNRRADGQARMKAPELISKYSTFVLPTQKGKVLMAIMDGKPKAAFALLKEVKISASHYLSNTLSQNTRKVVATMIQSIDRGLKK